MYTPQVSADDLRKRSNLGIAIGVLTAAIGVFLIAYPFISGAAATLILGGVLAVAGVAYVVHAFQSRSHGVPALRVIAGVLYFIAGVWLVAFPIAGLVALTLFLGVLLLVQAGLGAAIAFAARRSPVWGWFVFDAVVSLVLGLSILASWPWSSSWAIGTLVGVAVVFGGITRAMFSTVHRPTAFERDDAAASG